MNREIFKEYLPPILIKAIRSMGLFDTIQWSGNYKSWDDALTDSAGYDSDRIITKVASASMKVKNGEAAYERDSVVFETIEYSWPILAGLLWAFANDKKLNVIDFGGSLGSTYNQNRKFIDTIDKLIWNIVEQDKFVTIGREHFQSERLRFYYSIRECIQENDSNCLLLSSVLPYVRNPYELLEELLDYKFRFVFFDKMPFIEGYNDRITIQKVPESIYNASYPAWFFSEIKFKSFLEKKYTLVEQFLCKDQATIKSVYKGMIYIKR